jgi:hypothetical protein
MLGTTKNTSFAELRKLLRESVIAANVATKNREIIETLVSLSEITSGKYKKAISSRDLFKKVGV